MLGQLGVNILNQVNPYFLVIRILIVRFLRIGTKLRPPTQLATKLYSLQVLLLPE